MLDAFSECAFPNVFGDDCLESLQDIESALKKTHSLQQFGELQLNLHEVDVTGTVSALSNPQAHLKLGHSQLELLSLEEDESVGEMHHPGIRMIRRKARKDLGGLLVVFD